MDSSSSSFSDDKLTSYMEEFYQTILCLETILRFVTRTMTCYDFCLAVFGTDITTKTVYFLFCLIAIDEMKSPDKVGDCMHTCKLFATFHDINSSIVRAS